MGISRTDHFKKWSDLETCWQLISDIKWDQNSKLDKKTFANIDLSNSPNNRLSVATMNFLACSPNASFVKWNVIYMWSVAEFENSFTGSDGIYSFVFNFQTPRNIITYMKTLLIPWVVAKKLPNHKNCRITRISPFFTRKKIYFLLSNIFFNKNCILIDFDRIFPMQSSEWTKLQDFRSNSKINAKNLLFFPFSPKNWFRTD